MTFTSAALWLPTPWALSSPGQFQLLSANPLPDHSFRGCQSSHASAPLSLDLVLIPAPVLSHGHQLPWLPTARPPDHRGQCLSHSLPEPSTAWPLSFRPPHPEKSSQGFHSTCLPPSPASPCQWKKAYTKDAGAHRPWYPESAAHCSLGLLSQQLFQTCSLSPQQMALPSSSQGGTGAGCTCPWLCVLLPRAHSPRMHLHSAQRGSKERSNLPKGVSVPVLSHFSFHLKRMATPSHFDLHPPVKCGRQNNDPQRGPLPDPWPHGCVPSHDEGELRSLTC